MVGRRRELWMCENYIFLKEVITIAIGVYETFVLTSSIYGATESDTESGDTTQYLGMGDLIRAVPGARFAWRAIIFG